MSYEFTAVPRDRPFMDVASTQDYFFFVFSAKFMIFPISAILLGSITHTQKLQWYAKKSAHVINFAFAPFISFKTQMYTPLFKSTISIMWS